MANEHEYVERVGQTLEQFKYLSRKPIKAVARCPFCGDSKKNRYKKRFGFFERGDTLFAGCFNCNYCQPFKFFLREYDQNMFREYNMDNFSWNNGSFTKKTTIVTDFSAPTPKTVDYLQGLVKVETLPDDHMVNQYIDQRKLSGWQFYYAENFIEYASKVDPVKWNLDSDLPDHPRLVIPYLDNKGEAIGIIARTLTNVEPKYIKILDADRVKNFPFKYNMVDPTDDTIVVEGQLDALCLDNTFAAGNAALHSIASQMNLNKSKTVLVYDNEPYNHEVCKNIETGIKQGWYVCFFPSKVSKDISKMVELGVSKPRLRKYILENKVSGLEAMVQYGKWRKGLK